MTTETYRARRAHLMQRMAERGGGVAILPTAPELPRNRDSDFPFRFDSHFYYLSGFGEPEAYVVLVVRGGSQGKTHHEAILFCREKNEEREIWDGYRYGPDGAREAFGFDAAYAVADIDEQMPKLIADAPALFYAIGANARLDDQVQRWLKAVRAQSRAGVSAPAAAHDVHALIDEMRLYKDASEIAIMRRAAQISAAAHVRAMQRCKPGWREYEIEAELLHEFRRQGSQYPAYGSIVAAGPNACVLHYRAGDAQLKDGDLCLIDAGCELDGYAADITRTFPVNGRFSGPQRAIYDIVLAAQKAALEKTRPGQPYNAPHDAATRVLTQGMIDLGLLQGSVDGAIESNAHRQFYMHRTGHWLGLDVHDVGEYREPGTQRSDPERDDRPWRKLQPGMVVTIEPGFYVRPAANVPEHFNHIGVRIEDDVLITATGNDVLTIDVPKDAAEIEAVMRG